MATQKVVPEVVWDAVREYVAPDQSEVAAGNPPRIPSKFSGGHPAGPGDVDYSWVWETDFTPEQEAEWASIIKRARRRVEDVDDSEIQPYINVLKSWRNRTPGNETQAQMIQVLDAMTELWRLELREDN